MAPGDKHSKGYLQSREMSLMHISAVITALAGVAVGSKAGHFEWDGGLQCPNAW